MLELLIYSATAATAHFQFLFHKPIFQSFLVHKSKLFLELSAAMFHCQRNMQLPTPLLTVSERTGSVLSCQKGAHTSLTAL